MGFTVEQIQTLLGISVFAFLIGHILYDLVDILAKLLEAICTAFLKYINKEEK